MLSSGSAQMSALGQSGRLCSKTPCPLYPRKRTILSSGWNVRFVPKAGARPIRRKVFGAAARSLPPILLLQCRKIGLYLRAFVRVGKPRKGHSSAGHFLLRVGKKFIERGGIPHDTRPLHGRTIIEISNRTGLTSHYPIETWPQALAAIDAVTRRAGGERTLAVGGFVRARQN